MTGLFGDKPKKARKAPPPPSGVQAVIALYCELYTERLHEAPHFTKRDAGILATLVKQFGTDVVQARLRLFVTMADPYPREQGYPVALFSRMWSQIAALSAKTAATAVPFACAHTPRCRTAVAHGRLVIAEMKA